ncbi:MAG: Fic family protein [Bacteroidetes bacterium]|nr:Fic family protein [Bacteroidota bacterium]
MSNAEAERTIAMIHDQQDALEFVFSFVKHERQLSTSFIKELHSLFTKHQKTTDGREQFGNIIRIQIESGKYKTLPTNPTRPDGQLHEYCPPEHVDSEMDRLIQMHVDHMDKNVSPEIEAAWLHHRFVQINPFTDGNGRVALTLAT